MEGHLLSYLNGYGPCSLSELHRVLGLKRSTLTSMINRLEERALVERVPHPEDRRSFQVELQTRGRKLAVRLEAVGYRLEKEIDARVSARKRAGFESVMAAIAEITQIEVRPARK